MVAITQLSLWISALVVLSCQALLVTYIVESETFCEINSTEIDKVSKSVSEFLDDVSTSAKQMNLTNDFIPVCTLNKVEINNSTDLIGKKQPLVHMNINVCSSNIQKLKEGSLIATQITLNMCYTNVLYFKAFKTI